MTESFVPALTITDRDDAHAIWLAMMHYKYQQYTNAERYNDAGQYDLVQAAMREAVRANRLQESAYAQLRSLAPDHSSQESE